MNLGIIMIIRRLCGRLLSTSIRISCLAPRLPGLPVGTSTLGYHLMSLGALSGTQTPLAAVAGGSPFANGWSDSGIGPASRMRLEKPSVLAYPHAAMQQHQLLQQQQQRQQQQQQQQQQLEADLDSASRLSTASHPTAANKDNPNNGPDDLIIPSPGTSPHLGDPPFCNPPTKPPTTTTSNPPPSTPAYARAETRRLPSPLPCQIRR